MWLWVMAAVFGLLVVAPLVGAAAVHGGSNAPWWSANRESAGIAPDPATTAEAVIQVYAARTYGWRGVVGVHSWIAAKPAGADHYLRYEVIGWRLHHGGGLVGDGPGTPDAYWYGRRPELLAELRGRAAEAAMAKVARAAAAYPYPRDYSVWPGPNSNTFTAFVARAVPELRLDLPPTAVGKDYLPNAAIAASTPSGTGYQVSLFGLLGVAVGLEEGIEINLLGLGFGVDPNDLALRLPGLGRVGLL